MNEWRVHIKTTNHSLFEVSVCIKERDIEYSSWGWFGQDKIDMTYGSLEDSIKLATKVAAGLNLIEMSAQQESLK